MWKQPQRPTRTYEGKPPRRPSPSQTPTALPRTLRRLFRPKCHLSSATATNTPPLSQPRHALMCQMISTTLSTLILRQSSNR
ncbi:hypothetical protein BC830DRAFT_592806 [Chytriomyces sp. MP71]|nr:hypothetical protein BC830DRAFT_592806 [Chytriomyces sp. MP71]